MAELEIVRTKERVRVLEEVVKQQSEALKEGSRLLVKCRPIRSPPSCRKTCLVRNTSDARVSTTECTHNVPSSNTIPNRHEFFASIVNRKTHFSNGKRRRYRSCHERIFYICFALTAVLSTRLSTEKPSFSFHRTGVASARRSITIRCTVRTTTVYIL